MLNRLQKIFNNNIKSYEEEKSVEKSYDEIITKIAVTTAKNTGTSTATARKEIRDFLLTF